jgi:hypothetical protein
MRGKRLAFGLRRHWRSLPWLCSRHGPLSTKTCCMRSTPTEWTGRLIDAPRRIKHINVIVEAPKLDKVSIRVAALET